MNEYLTVSRRTKRDRIEVVYEILVALRESTLKHSVLMRRVGVCHAYLASVVPILIENKYISLVCKDDFKFYSITEDGLKVLDFIERIVRFKEVSRL